MRKYAFHSKIEHHSKLSILFNKALEELLSFRIVCKPMVYNNQEDEKDFYSTECHMFYQLCLFENYLHSIINNLDEWLIKVNKYNTDYNGSWKYYAASERLELIDKYGGG